MRCHAVTTLTTTSLFFLRNKLLSASMLEQWEIGIKPTRFNNILTAYWRCHSVHALVLMSNGPRIRLAIEEVRLPIAANG